jgi:hypothetical protein
MIPQLKIALMTGNVIVQAAAPQVACVAQLAVSANKNFKYK